MHIIHRATLVQLDPKYHFDGQRSVLNGHYYKARLKKGARNTIDTCFSAHIGFIVLWYSIMWIEANVCAHTRY